MPKLIKKQATTLLTNTSKLINKEILTNVIPKESRCYNCNSKLFNLYIDSIIECKCRKCKAFNYYQSKLKP